MGSSSNDPYTIRVVGEAEGPFSGSRPEEIGQLIKKPSKDTASLIFKASSAMVDLCCQKGDVAGAFEAIRKYQEKDFEYAAPKNVFQRDLQNGRCPYIGAHMVFGAIRDAAKLAFNDKVKFYTKKGDESPSAKHFRKFVMVKPHHIFMYRPTMGGKVIGEVDVPDDAQQPCGDVKGFSRYEVLHPPFQFEFQVMVVCRGPFPALADRELMIAILNQAAFHGLGSRRAAGNGQWRIVSASVE